MSTEVPAITSPTSLVWPGGDPARVIAELAPLLARPGLVVVRFVATGVGPPTPWPALEQWTTARAVTVADVVADLAVPALELALCADLVVLRAGVTLSLPGPAEAPTAGLTWAAGRGGASALRHALLVGGPLAADTALALGLAHAVVARDAPLPLPDPVSLPAVTAARDLLRCDAGRGRAALELATFRFLFATGHPEEGARAFLDRRPPTFADGG